MVQILRGIAEDGHPLGIVGRRLDGGWAPPVRNRKFARFSAGGDWIQHSVPGRERGEAPSGLGTVTEATKVRLEAVAYLPRTDGSNPFPSSGESGELRYRCYAGWGLSQAFYREEIWRKIAFSSLEDFLIDSSEVNFRRRDANDLLACCGPNSTPTSAPTSFTAATSIKHWVRSPPTRP